MSKRKTKEQVVDMLQKHIHKYYKNNQSAAGREWDEHRNVVYEVLAGRRNPTKKMLAALGLKKDSTTFYIALGE